MRRMDGKARMMVMGAGIGAASAALLVALAASGLLGGWGFLAVVMLAGLAGFGGWLLGCQTRARMDRDRIWLEGYKEGRKGAQFADLAFYYRITPLLDRPGH